jgi:hypothetical protein
MNQKMNSVPSAETNDEVSTNTEVSMSSPNNAKPNVGGSFCLTDYCKCNHCNKNVSPSQCQQIEQILYSDNKETVIGFHCFECAEWITYPKHIEIKHIEQIMRFRAWDITNNKWAYVGFHLFGEVTIFGLLEQYNFENACKDLEFTQFVNLQDKCKEDLYVGDLFKCETDDMVYRIFAVDGGFAINTHVQRWQKDIKDDYPFPLIPLSDEQTVSWIKGSCLKIGNIYENPEIIRGVS